MRLGGPTTWSRALSTMIGAASLASNTSRVAPSIHDCIPPDGCILLAGGFAVRLQLALLRAALELSAATTSQRNLRACKKEALTESSESRRSSASSSSSPSSSKTSSCLNKSRCQRWSPSATELAGVLAELADLAVVS